MRTTRKFRRTPWLLNQGQEMYGRKEDSRERPPYQAAGPFLRAGLWGSKASLDPWQVIDLFTRVAFCLQQVEIPTTDVPGRSLTHPNSLGGTNKGPGYF